MNSLPESKFVGSHLKTRFGVLVDVHLFRCRRVRHAKFSFARTARGAAGWTAYFAWMIHAGVKSEAKREVAAGLPTRRARKLAGRPVYEGESRRARRPDRRKGAKGCESTNTTLTPASGIIIMSRRRWRRANSRLSRLRLTLFHRQKISFVGVQITYLGEEAPFYDGQRVNCRQGSLFWWSINALLGNDRMPYPS